MKLLRHGCRVAVLAATLVLTGCSTSPMSRIDANRALYESWPLEVKEAILDGKVVKGMTPEMVEMAAGKPTEITSRGVQAGTDEVWIYRKGGGGSLLGNTGVSLGGAIGTGGGGGISVGTGTSTSSQPSSGDEREVVFENGVVVRSDVGT
jgi:hypothetical protein